MYIKNIYLETLFTNNLVSISIFNSNHNICMFNHDHSIFLKDLHLLHYHIQFSISILFYYIDSQIGLFQAFYSHNYVVYIPICLSIHGYQDIY